MPAKSKVQFRFMKLMEKNPELRKKMAPGLSKNEASEYTSENCSDAAYSKLPEKKPSFSKLKSYLKG